MPLCELGRAAVPVALSPMKLPRTMFAVVEPSKIAMPSPAFPEITLRAAAVLPPMTLPEAPLPMTTPLVPAREPVPAALVPR